MPVLREYAARTLAVLLGCALQLACAVPAQADDAAASAASAVPGQLPLLMIVVGFDGAGDADPVPYSDSYDWASAVFGGQDSVSSYYEAVSGGKFSIVPARETSASGEGNANAADAVDDGVAHVTLHQAYRPWGLVNTDEEVMQDFGAMVIDAFHEAGRYVDYAAYDADGDGRIAADELAVAVCLAGYDASAFDDPGRSDVPAMWPHAGKLATAGQEPAANPDGPYALDSYIAITEKLWYEEDDISQAIQEPLGVLYHELGHYLGLPDLYPLNDDAEAQDWGAYRVRSLSLMDAGGWASVEGPDGRPAFRPTALDAWSRYVLGWALPQVASSTGDYVVSSQLSDSGYRSLLVPTSDADVCYLLENREFEGVDEALAADYAQASSAGGIVAWRVNKAMCGEYGEDNHVNDTDREPGVMPLFFERTADGAYTLDTGAGTPVKEEPFISADSLGALLGNPDASVTLPLGGPTAYGSESGVRISVASSPARDLIVHVEFDDSPIAESSGAHELMGLGSLGQRSQGADEAAVGDAAEDGVGEAAVGDAAEDGVGEAAGREGGAGDGARDGVSHGGAGDGSAQDAGAAGPVTMEDLACAALMRETGSDIAVVGATAIAHGLPAGPLSYADAYSALPQDEVIRCYDVPGARLMDLLESSASGIAARLGEATAPGGAADAGEGVVYEGGADDAGEGAVDEGGADDAGEGANSNANPSANASAAAAAEELLSFGGITCTMDLGAPEGGRVTDVLVGSEPLDPAQSYLVAVPERLGERLGLPASAERRIFKLDGSPADALRSFLQGYDWESAASEYAGKVSYVFPPVPSAPGLPSLGGLVSQLLADSPFGGLALAVLAAACVLAGAVVTLVTRR